MAVGVIKIRTVDITGMGCIISMESKIGQSGLLLPMC